MADPLTHSHDTSTPAMSDETVPSEEFVLVPHPGYGGKLYPAQTVLSDLAGQEGCDGEPYDTMQNVADALRSMKTRSHKLDAHAVIRQIVVGAENVASCAGVGSLETAGQIVSFLASRPSLMPSFMAGTLSAVDSGLLDHHNGVLSWHGMDGDIHEPDPSKAHFPAIPLEDLFSASTPNPSPAAKGGEAVVVPYDDFHAAYGFVPRSKVSPDRCLKTRLRALLRAEDLAHADEAEALATSSPQPADAVREALEEARSLLKVEYYDDGRIAAVGHDSDGLRKMVALLDAALSTPTEGPASQTEGMGGEVKAKAKQALYSLRFEGQPMSSMFSAEELGLIVDTVSAALSTPTEGPASQTEGMGGDATKLRENIEAFLEMHRRGVLTPRTPNIPIELLQKALAALTQPETAEAVPPLYLIRKGGAFYRPNSQGYTRSIAEAGRYSLAEAEAITHPNGPNGPRDGMDYIPAPALASDPAPATDDRERLLEALKSAAVSLEQAAGRFNLMGGVGLVNGADPKAGYAEAYEASCVARAALATETSR